MPYNKIIYHSNFWAKNNISSDCDHSVFWNSIKKSKKNPFSFSLPETLDFEARWELAKKM